MENILFIGGAGFLGSNIILYMAQRGCCNRIFVLEPPSANVSRLKNCEVTMLRGCLNDISYIESLILSHNIGTVVHLVSTLVPGSDFKDYVNELHDVVIPTIELMRICSRRDVKFVYFSSGGTIYGERMSLDSFSEKDPKEPISYYGLSKQMLENGILFEHRVSGLEYLILWPSNPYGPGQNVFGRQGLIAVSLGKILTGEPVTIWGNGLSIIDYIYIDDFADIIFKLLKQDIKNATVNVGSGRGYSVNQVIDILKETVTEEVTKEYADAGKSNVSNMILDISLLKRIVDVHFTPLHEGIRKFYEYEKVSITHDIFKK